MGRELNRARDAARIVAATRSAHELMLAIDDAFARIERGEFGEPAVAQEASIEAFQDEEGGPPPIKLFIQRHEEAVDYAPDEARRLACNLWAMADVAEELHAAETKQQHEDQHGDVEGRSPMDDLPPTTSRY